MPSLLFYSLGLLSLLPCAECTSFVLLLVQTQHHLEAQMHHPIPLNCTIHLCLDLLFYQLVKLPLTVTCPTKFIACSDRSVISVNILYIVTIAQGWPVEDGLPLFILKFISIGGFFHHHLSVILPY